MIFLEISTFILSRRRKKQFMILVKDRWETRDIWMRPEWL